MDIINYTYARANLKKVMDSASLTGEPTLIISKKNQVVIMSKSKYQLLIKGVGKC
jgi:prevent-host-death family protein